jgi:Leucine-rich repeat (LRR) protein
VDIDLSGNQLTDCVSELSSLQFLKKLNLTDNNITDIWKLPPPIEHLILSNNKIESFNTNVFSLQNLTILEATHNYIKDLCSLEFHKKIALLNLDFNQITNIKGIQQLPTLSLCSFQSNKICNVKEISYLAPLQMLSHVNLKDNPLLCIDNLPVIISSIMPCFRLHTNTGTLSKARANLNAPKEQVDVEEEYFSDSTYKSLESTIKSTIGELIKEGKSPNNDYPSNKTVECEEVQDSQQRPVDEILLTKSNITIKRVSIPKLNLNGNNMKQKLDKSIDRVPRCGDISFEYKTIEPNTQYPHPKKNVVVPKLNLKDGNGMRVIYKTIGDKALINESGRTCESSKNKIEECNTKINTIRDKNDQKSSKTYSSQRSVSLLYRKPNLISNL